MYVYMMMLIKNAFSENSNIVPKGSYYETKLSKMAAKTLNLADSVQIKNVGGYDAADQ